jgi:hypothetical protein
MVYHDDINVLHRIGMFDWYNDHTMKRKMGIKKVIFVEFFEFWSSFSTFSTF